MGINSLIDQVNGTPITADNAINPIKSAIVEDNYPRNTDGDIENVSGELGSSSFQWIKAFIASGFWSIGDIKAHHTYNNLASIGQGWFPCVGDIINETNYDLIHGAGSWAQYIVSTVFDGKYSPNLTDRYNVGASDTTDDGSVAIPATGNTSHEIDIQHVHVGGEHNHNWYGPFGSTNTIAIQLDTIGNVGSSYDSDGNVESPLGSGTIISKQMYTSNEQQLFGLSLSTTQSIRPEALEVIYYLRLI